jgi:hypothetical protein
MKESRKEPKLFLLALRRKDSSRRDLPSSPGRIVYGNRFGLAIWGPSSSRTNVGKLHTGTHISVLNLEQLSNRWNYLEMEGHVWESDVFPVTGDVRVHFAGM